jgi:hypothetical protein
MDDDADVWTYGTVLRNPGCDFVVMYLSPHETVGISFHAVVLHDGLLMGTGTGWHRGGDIVCGGRPDDPRANRWVVLP